MTDREVAHAWRLRLGAGVFVVSFASPFLLVPLVVGSTLSPEWKTALSGLFAVGVPDLGMVVGVGVMGKPGFEMLKRRLLRPLARFLPADEVGRVRHRIGLAMFSLPLLYAWVGPYLEPAIGLGLGWVWRLIPDLVFVASFFVLGGAFWDRVRSLFEWTGGSCS